MKQKTSLKTLLIEIISRFPSGCSIEQIALALDPKTPRRTLQRRLAELQNQGVILTEGHARARRYKLPPPQKNISFLLGPDAASLQIQIIQPIQTRKAASYNREFLEDYDPNKTFYLSSQTRARLQEIGCSNDTKYPAGTYARKIFHRLLIDLSWNSSRLEGNTYSLLETERLIEQGKAVANKSPAETQMILNHKAAIEFLIHTAEEIGINRYTFLNLHSLLADNLLSDPAACGRLRTIPVGIAHSVYLPPNIPALINEYFDLIITKAKAIQDPFEQAFFLMVQIPYLQPFEDVNKRTSRLAANIPLIRQNLCPLSFIDVPEETYINGLLAIYELNRIEILRDTFIWAYERSCALYSSTRKVLGEPDPFRLKYRQSVYALLTEIVRNRINKEIAIALIRKETSQLVPEIDRSRFIEMVERELLSLHEGNIARYDLKPIEFQKWKENWDRG